MSVFKKFNNNNSLPGTKEITWETKLSFGKYKGASLSDVLDNDPKYLDWMLDNCFDKTIKDFLIKNKEEIQLSIPDDDDMEYPDKDF